jgi:hypothetical protein
LRVNLFELPMPRIETRRSLLQRRYRSCNQHRHKSGGHSTLKKPAPKRTTGGHASAEQQPEDRDSRAKTRFLREM